MKNYSSYVDSFLEYLDFELNYAQKTIITYRQVLKVYGAFLEKNHYNFLNINKDIANKYKAYLINLGYQNKTSSLNLSGVRSFYNYLIEIRAINNNYFLNIHNPKVVKKLPNFLKESEVKTILNKTDDNNYELRSEFIVEFLYATGLRVSEFASLKVSDLNSDGTIKVMGKGSKERIVFYKAMDNNLLNQYLNEVRPSFVIDSNDYLVPGKKGKALSTRRIEELVKEYALKKDLKSKITPHTLRHSFATSLLNNEADIRSVGELLGHESLSTTQIYTHVTNEKLKEIYKKTHPRK